MTDSLPFRLISDAQKKEIESQLSQVINGWSRIWFSSIPGISIGVIETDQIVVFNADDWLVFGKAPDAWIAWKVDGVATRELLSIMFDFSMGNSAKLSPIMTDILGQFAFSFALELAGHCQLASQSISELSDQLHNLRTGWGSGAVSIKFKIGAVPQHIAIGGDYGSILGPIGFYDFQGVSLAKREDTINDYHTSLEVLVGNAEVTLEELANLEIGDVIRLGSLIQEPFTIRSTGGKPMANAYLGVNGHVKAIKLIE